MKIRTELLIPAGDKERAYYALNYGADAIFLGAKMFSLRARASNFNINEIRETVAYAHSLNKKVYLVVNTICHNHLANEFIKFFKEIAQLNIDGFIVADPYIIKTLHDVFSDCEIHLSTQQSVTNSKAALFFKKWNVKRVVLAREMKYDEIALLNNSLRGLMEVEIFIHGAVCIAYSGRCMMSNNFSLRDSNVGGCAQSCRWMYHLEDYSINHFFTMSAKDMSYFFYLKKLLDLNLSCFKVEGRMKSLNYITIVTKIYRKIIDQYYQNKKINKNEYTHLLDVANREIDDAFLLDANENKMLYHDEQKNVNQNYLFVINEKINNNTFYITSKNYFNLQMNFKLITPKNEYKIKIISLKDENQNIVNVVHTPMTKLIMQIDKDIEDWEYAIGKRNEI